MCAQAMENEIFKTRVDLGNDTWLVVGSVPELLRVKTPGSCIQETLRAIVIQITGSWLQDTR